MTAPPARRTTPSGGSRSTGSSPSPGCRPMNRRSPTLVQALRAASRLRRWTSTSTSPQTRPPSPASSPTRRSPLPSCWPWRGSAPSRSTRSSTRSSGRCAEVADARRQGGARGTLRRSAVPGQGPRAGVRGLPDHQGLPLARARRGQASTRSSRSASSTPAWSSSARRTPRSSAPRASPRTRSSAPPATRGTSTTPPAAPRAAPARRSRAGIVPAAGANDGGGSVRIPAACNGLVGLKLSRGLTPYGPQTSESMFGMVTQGVVSRTVRDSAALLDAVAGVPDRYAAYVAGRPEPVPAEPRPASREAAHRVLRTPRPSTPTPTPRRSPPSRTPRRC